MDYRTLAARIAQEEGVPSDLFLRLVNQESGFQPNVTSSAGAYGLTQLMPGTARDLGVDPTDPEQNLRGGARYLRQQLDRFGEPSLALAAYNAGPGRVQQYGGIPPFEETQNYVRSILGGSPVSVSTSGTGGAAMPDNMQQGLLGSRPAQQGNGFWDNFLGGALADPDRRARIGMALQGMTMNPNQALIQAAQSGIEERKQGRIASRTAEWLRSQPGGEAYVQMLEAGGNPASIIQSYMQSRSAAASAAQGEIKEVNGRLVRVMPDGSVTELYGGGPDQEAIVNARKEFTSLQPVKDFSNVSFAYSRVMRSAEDPSPAGDLALIFNYMKILDPGSVVREGEFATAQNSGGVDDRVRSLYNNVISGERLTPEQRADFADRATRLYSGAQEQYNALARQYSGFARQAGLPVEQVIPDFGYAGNLYQKPLIYQRPAAPQGINEAEWATAWQNMTDQERAVFLGDMAND